MHQHNYISNLLLDFAYLQGKTALVPLNPHHTLLKEADSRLLHDVTAYRRLVGKLIYLIISFPYLAYMFYLCL